MLHRWVPFAELQRIQDDLARVTRREREPRSFTPAVDIFEDKDAIVVRAELPGVKAEDVSITVENDVLTLSGERKLERREEGDGWHRVESAYGSFTRSFALPKTVDTSNIEAQLDSGILTVRLPKRAEAQPRKISVKVGGGAKEIAAKA